MTDGKNAMEFKALGIKAPDKDRRPDKGDLGERRGYQPTPQGNEKDKVADLAARPPKGGSAIQKPTTQPKKPTK